MHNNMLSSKIDVGVHTDYNILQDELCFNTIIENNQIKLFANSKEQIFVEKIIPIIKFGLLTTRYKDFFDIYWLIENGSLNKKKINDIITEKIFNNNINDVDSINKILEILKNMLNNKFFIKKLFTRKNNWLEINDEALKNVILDYFKNMI